jgi:uncharacterized SAM-binding protein YcdF (DUF218 family)
VVVVLVLLAAVAWPLWAPAIGLSLIARDQLVPADAIVVLAGNAPQRLMQGEKLFDAGYAPLLIVSDEPVVTFGMETTWYALFLAGVAAPSIPRDRVIPLDPLPTSTIDEARESAAILEQRGLRSAIVVTDEFHSRRSRLLFQAEYRRHGLQVTSYPVEGQEAPLAAWWVDPIVARSVMEEYVKTAYYFVRGDLF